jgi:uncharacterized membrane protein YkoI
MRKNIGIGITAAAAAIALTTGAGAALAASGGQQQARTAAAAAAHRNVTKAQARQIAKAKVPHSRVIEVESDDLHNRPVWKVKLATPHSRVTVDVDKKTGKATIIRNGERGQERRDDRGERHDRDDKRGHHDFAAHR